MRVRTAIGATLIVILGVGASIAWLGARAPEDVALPDSTSSADATNPVATVTDAELAAASDLRAEYGLPADPDVVRAIIESGEDVGSQRWGVVLTDQEAAALDMEGRHEFERAMGGAVLPIVRGMDTYGGSFFDHAADGNLVVLFTERDAEAEVRLRALVRDGPRTVVFRTGGHTAEELQAAADRVIEAWSAVGGTDPLTLEREEIMTAANVILRFGPNQDEGSLTVGIGNEEPGWSESIDAELEELVGVPLEYEPAVPAEGN